MAKKALTAEELQKRAEARKIKEQEKIASMTPEEKAAFDQMQSAKAKFREIEKRKSEARKIERADETKAVWVVFRSILAMLKKGEDFYVKLFTKIMNETQDAEAKQAIGRIIDRATRK